MTEPLNERLKELARRPGQYPASWDAPWKEPPTPISPDLRNALYAAHQRTLAMTPAEKQAMYEAQRQSFVRAMAPCEHGDPDWETCPQCLQAFHARASQADTPQDNHSTERSAGPA